MCRPPHEAEHILPPTQLAPDVDAGYHQDDEDASHCNHYANLDGERGSRHPPVLSRGQSCESGTEFSRKAGCEGELTSAPVLLLSDGLTSLPGGEELISCVVLFAMSRSTRRTRIGLLYSWCMHPFFLSNLQNLPRRVPKKI